MKIKTRGVRSVDSSGREVADPSDLRVVESVEAAGPAEAVDPSEGVESPDSCVAVSAEDVRPVEDVESVGLSVRVSAKRRPARRAVGPLMGFLYGDLC